MERMMQYMKKWKWLACGLVALTLTVGLFARVAFAQEADGNNTVTVCVTMEKFTLGQGYKIEPILVTLPAGTKTAQVITDLLGPGNYENTGTVADSFYLSSIKDGDTDISGVPQYILDKTGPLSPKDRSDDQWLGEFDYYTNSGWMYAINNSFPGVGASGTTLAQGDVLRWQYTLYGLGADLGADNTQWGGVPLINAANKDALTWRVAEINGMANKADVLAQGENQKKYDGATAVLKDMESTQDSVDTALAALNRLDEAPAVTGDADGDGYITGNDLAVVNKYFGTTVETGQNGDVDADGFITGNDLAVVNKYFGTTGLNE
ncbi:dockerin type I domain-containing protein [Eubacterium aggregans]|uniref:dockerin type I domain-containing protein n=1 Tax=Eubacterium aggregans TaxID=81409 RepID=UPI001FA75619|nr:DUF4430 domain-containing protein [Eubacterium aggregans]